MRCVKLGTVLLVLVTLGGATIALAGDGRGGDRGRHEWSGKSKHVVSATLRNTAGDGVGEVSFRERGGKTSVEVRVSGLPPGFHGFHVHTAGRCTPPDFTSAGGHLNPADATHPNHAGDMSTLLVNADGTGMVALETDRFSLSDLRDADGSAVIVHALQDNYANIPTDRYDPDPDAATLSTGDAGARIACGRVPADPEVAESVDVLPRIGHRPCVRGFAGPFRCNRVDLLSFLPMDEIGGGPASIYGGPGNDVWGWTDPRTRREWVIAGRSNGTSFIDVSNPKKPVFVANLPAHGVTELHSDMKVYKDHAFIVKDGPDNGIQVFDLTRLRDIDDDDAPITVDADAVYEGISNAHDIAINEDTGFAYAVGATRDVAGVPPCHGGGLHMVDIRDPKNPTFAGCFDDDGYTHDVQCVIYHGPDQRYQGRELCFASNPSSPDVIDALTIVDVTDKANPVLVGKVFEGEPNTYSHQGWLTEDHRYFLHDDESDNGSSSQAIQGRSRNRVFDVTDLENPVLQSVYHGETRAPVHNLYVRGRYMYNANYIDGLRIVDITKIDHPGDEFAPETPSAPDHQGLREVGCFDTDPFRNDMGVFPNGRTAWGGSWSNYPYFKSRIVVVSGFDGLFLVKPDVDRRWGDFGGNRRSNVCLP